MQIEFNKLNLYQRNWHKGKIKLNIDFVKLINQIEEITKEIFKSILISIQMHPSFNY